MQTEPWCIQSSGLWPTHACVRWKPRKWKEERNRWNSIVILSHTTDERRHIFIMNTSTVTVRHRHRGPAECDAANLVQCATSQYCSKELSLILLKNIYVYTKSQNKVYLFVEYHHTSFFHLNVSHPDRRRFAGRASPRIQGRHPTVPSALAVSLFANNYCYYYYLYRHPKVGSRKQNYSIRFTLVDASCTQKIFCTCANPRDHTLTLIMEGEISSILVSIRERYRHINANHMKLHPCHLKNVNVGALELLELVLETESDIPGVGSNSKQVRISYSSLFDPPYSEAKLKPAAARKTILIQGEAAVGKTVLCMSIVEDWASGKLFQEFQIVLLLPLSSSSIASASTLSGLLNVLYTDFKADTCSQVANYLKRNRQHNVLIIADGWEELQASQCQTGSFLHSLLFSRDIIPTSSVTVLITSRPGCVQMNDILQSVDRLITLTGFDRKAIESLVQSEFASDFNRVHYLIAQLNDNPLVESTCSIPLNFAIVCNQCQSSDAEPLPNTTTGIYSKLIWTLASASINSNDLGEGSLSSNHDLPEELQQSWWQVCELAFRNIEKGYSTYSQSDAAVFISSEILKKISYFGMIKPVAESEDSLCFSFIHPHFKEYLAALHLAKQPQEAQLMQNVRLPLISGTFSSVTIHVWY